MKQFVTNISSLMWIFIAVPLLVTTASVANGQWLNDYSYKRIITIDPTALPTSPLVDFPVFIKIDAPWVASEDECDLVKNQQGFDIVFTRHDGTTTLSHTIQKYDQTNGTIEVWIRLPELSSTENQIDMYYGRRGSVADPSTTNTWGNDFISVWHFDDAGQDATASVNKLESLGTWGDESIVEELCGSAIQYDGITNYLETDNEGPFDFGREGFTISGWLRGAPLPGEDIENTISVVDVSISSGSDDAEEVFPGGTVSLSSSDLELGNESGGANLVGLRFSSVNIPQGSRIVDAYLEFTTDDDVSSTSTRVFIYAEDQTNPPTFASGTGQKISDRQKTVSFVDWVVDPWATADVKDQTPELTELVQTIVDKSGWSANNSMVFILEGYGKRFAQSYEKSGGIPAKLHIEFESENGTASVTSIVANPSDDVNEVGGTILFGTTASKEWLELGTSAYCGIRFSTVDIPYGAVIQNAYLSFYAAANTSITSNLNIYAEDTGNSPAFDGSAYEVTNKAKTLPVAWPSVPAWTSGNWYTSPQIKNLVQSIVSKSNWTEGSAMTFIINGTGRRAARSGDYGNSFAPKLVVEYSVPVSATQGLIAKYSDEAGFKAWIGSNGRLYFGIDDDEQWDPDAVVSSKSNVVDNSWHHFAISKAGNDSLSVFIDGKFENSEGVNTKSVFKRIGGSTDDAEENPGTGAVNRTSSVLEISRTASAQNIVGLRFSGINIPAGSRIIKANIGMMVQAVSSTDINSVEVRGRDVSNANTFQGTSFELSNIWSTGATSAQVTWEMGNFTKAGDVVFTPDLSAIVDEIVNQTAGWNTGNAMAFILNGGHFGRNVVSYDANVAKSAFLIIEYQDDPLGTLSSTASFQLGADRHAYGFYGGKLDEVHVMRRPIEQAWARAQYLNLSSLETFIAVGQEQRIVGSGSGNWSDGNAWNIGVVPQSGVDIYLGNSSLVYLDSDVVIGGLQLDAGAELALSGNKLTVTCNVENNGNLITTNSAVEFAGRGDQEINGASNTTFFDLLINNDGNTLKLNQNIAIEHELQYLSDGKLDLNGSTLEINSEAIVGLGQNSDRTIIVGGISQVIVSSLGDGESISVPLAYSSDIADFARVDITNNSGSPEEFALGLCNTVFTDGSCDGSGGGREVLENGVGITWNIHTNSNNALITLFWHQDKELLGFDNSLCAVNHFNGSSWEVISDASASTVIDNNIFSISSEVYDFSPLGVGGGQTPLPVEFLYFEGEKRQSGMVLLSWATAMEVNNEMFLVERSLDGKKYLEIGRVHGAGNSSQVLEYTFVDDDYFSANTYYRIKQVDFDGLSEYSSVVLIEGESLNNSISRVYPNPISSSSSFNVAVDCNVTADEVFVTMSDLSGQRIFADVYPVTSGAIHISRSLSIPSGIYFLTISGENFKATKKILVE